MLGEACPEKDVGEEDVRGRICTGDEEVRGLPGDEERLSEACSLVVLGCKLVKDRLTLKLPRE